MQHDLVAILIDGLPLLRIPSYGQLGLAIETLARHDIPVLVFPITDPHDNPRVNPPNDPVSPPALNPNRLVGQEGGGENRFRAEFVPLFEQWYRRQKASLPSTCRFILGGYSAGGHLIYAWCTQPAWAAANDVAHVFTLAAPHTLQGDVEIQDQDGGRSGRTFPVHPSIIDQVVLAQRLQGKLSVFYGRDDIMVRPDQARFPPRPDGSEFCYQREGPVHHHHSIGTFSEIRKDLEAKIRAL